MVDSHHFENRTSPFMPLKTLCKRRMKNTETGNKTNINSKNNSLSVCYKVTVVVISQLHSSARRYASVVLSVIVFPSICPSHASIVSKWLNTGSSTTFAGHQIPTNPGFNW